MNHTLTDRHDLPAGADVLEARFGLRVASRLHEASAELPHDITERLRIARQQAVQHAQAKAAKRRLVPQSVDHFLHQGGGTAIFGRMGGGAGDPWWARLGSLVPLLLLVIGLLGVSEILQEEQISTTAEVDAALLGDNLPPSAYSDPGFAEFLQAAPSPAAADQ